MKGMFIKRIAAFLSSAIILFGLCLPISAEEKEDKVIKVGYMDYHGFVDKQSDGLYTGYCVEYLDKISEYTGFRYEYVYGEWQQLLDMLENGEIDMLCNAQYTDARAEKYDFSAYPIGYTQGLLYTSTDNDTLFYEDYRSFDGTTVGVISKSAMRDMFLRYCEQHDFSCNIKEYESENALVDALDDGQVDAICSEHLANHTNLVLLAKYGSDAYYIISYKGSPYIKQVNFALQQIKTDVDFESELFHKYYDSSTAETTVQFTAEEKEFISECGALNVGLQKNRAPFSSLNKKNGKFEGICIDILDEIAKESGLKFNYIAQTVGMKTPDLMKTGNYDLICGVERDNFISNESITSTEAFFESAIVPVGRAGAEIDLNSSLVAAVPSSFQALQKKIAADYPNITLIYFNSNRECLEAVRSGEADIYIQNTHILSSLLQEPRYEELDIIPVEIMTEHTAIAIGKDEGPVLLSVLNKCISRMSDAYISSSLISHTFAAPYQYTTSDILYKFRIQIIVIALMTVLCFTLTIRVAVIRRHGEEKLKKKNELLADAVVQADRASTAKTEFLSRMSHEIRTPMNAIVGFTEIARKHEAEPQRIDDYLDKISTSSKILLNIINDILDMSAIESNKLKISNTDFDMKQILNNISTIYYPQCKNKGIHFEMAIDIENEVLRGDSLRVSQILLNLVSNAYKFTEKDGYIRIFVKETAHKDNVAFLCFTVSDSGCGMSPDMLERIFKPFEQETSDTAQKYGGSGLGLSITKNLVGIMHGAINVESEKGKGTTFTINLPFDIPDKKNVADLRMLKSVRILAVEDDYSAMDYTKTVLERIGLDFDMCDSGKNALEMIEKAQKERPYDVCLFDWAIGDISGADMIGAIHRISGEKPILIIVSSYDINEVEKEARAAGADYFVSKPLFQSTVFNVLMELTNGMIFEKSTSEKKYDFSGHRVLLAEDRELNAEIAVELLSMVKMSADCAKDGLEALEMFKKAPEGTYDLILMDIQMPIMDGYKATQAIRELERSDAKTIPIYAMTANAFTEDISLALSSGMNDHIAKPIDTDILYEKLYKEIFKK